MHPRNAMFDSHVTNSIFLACLSIFCNNFTKFMNELNLAKNVDWLFYLIHDLWQTEKTILCWLSFAPARAARVLRVEFAEEALTVNGVVLLGLACNEENMKKSALTVEHRQDCLDASNLEYFVWDSPARRPRTSHCSRPRPRPGRGRPRPAARPADRRSVGWSVV